MKHLNRINQWVQRGKKIREMDLLTGIVVLIACFFVGAALHCHAQKKDLETAGQVIYPETENWGLGFGQEGEKTNRKCVGGRIKNLPCRIYGSDG